MELLPTLELIFCNIFVGAAKKGGESPLPNGVDERVAKTSNNRFLQVVLVSPQVIGNVAIGFSEWQVILSDLLVNGMGFWY